MNDAYIRALQEQRSEVIARIEDLNGKLKAQHDMKRAVEEKLRELEQSGSLDNAGQESLFPNVDDLPVTPVTRVVREIMSEHPGGTVKDSFVLEEATKRGFVSTSKNPRQTIYWALRHLQRANLVKRVGRGLWTGLSA